MKFRGLRLDSGNFSWGSEGVSKKTRVIAVAYHPSNNELVRKYLYKKLQCIVLTVLQAQTP